MLTKPLATSLYDGSGPFSPRRALVSRYTHAPGMVGYSGRAIANNDAANQGVGGRHKRLGRAHRVAVAVPRERNLTGWCSMSRELVGKQSRVFAPGGRRGEGAGADGEQPGRRWGHCCCFGGPRWI